MSLWTPKLLHCAMLCLQGGFICRWPVKLAAHSLLFALFTREILFMVCSLLWLLQWKHDLIPAPRTHSGLYLDIYVDIYSISAETHIIYGLQMWAVDLDIFHPSPGILAFHPQLQVLTFPGQNIKTPAGRTVSRSSKWNCETRASVDVWSVVILIYYKDATIPCLVRTNMKHR